MATTASILLLRKPIWRVLGWLGMLLLFFTTNVFAAQAVLSWAAISGASGYRVYQVQTNETAVNLGTLHVTDASPVVADVATTTATINLVDGKTYYFALKAYNSTSVSAFSNEVGKTLPALMPSANFSVDKTSGSAPLTVKFTDSSTNATSWSWNFGDNTTSTLQNPAKTYSTAGTYSVTLTVHGSGASNSVTKTNLITVATPSSLAPIASFNATPTTGTAPLTVTFTDTSTGGSVTNWCWKFGDTVSSTCNSTAKSAVKTYADTGKDASYTASLTVSNAAGSSTTIKTISVKAAPVIANFSVNTTSGKAPLAASFTNLSTGVNLAGYSYSWNFGDGGASTEINPVHTYAQNGSYTVSLTAKRPDGASNTKTQTGYITVSSTTSTNAGLVAAYNFEEASGATVVDASGKGNHGAITEAARTTSGKAGQALYFDGVNDWVTVKDSASLDLTSGMTLEAWVYPSATMSSWRSILLKERNGGLSYGLYANSDASQPVTSINVGNDQNLSGGSMLATYTWTHLAATYDGVTERLYINGNQVASKAQTGGMTVSTGALRIGGNSVWDEFFKGRIDEVRIYNRALSATEIKTDMTTPVANSSPPSLLLGNQAIGSKTDTISKGTAKAFQKQAAKTGQITNVSVYVVAGSTPVVAGLYANNNGRPGTLLAQGTLSSPKAGAWNQIAFPATSVTAGNTYWIAILSPGGTLQVSDKVGGGTLPSETSPVTKSTTLPANWWTSGTPSYDSPLTGYGAGY